MNCANARNFRKYGKKIVAVLRNYRDHAAEMGQQTMPTVPAFFLKPTSAFVEEGESVIVPRGCAKLQHEVELGVVIAKRASKITLSNALDFVAGYALALDMTARDFQEFFIAEVTCPVYHAVHYAYENQPGMVTNLQKT